MCFTELLCSLPVHYIFIELYTYLSTYKLTDYLPTNCFCILCDRIFSYVIPIPISIEPNAVVLVRLELKALSSRGH